MQEKTTIMNKINLLGHLGNLAQTQGGLELELATARTELQKSLAKDILKELEGTQP